MTIKTRVVIALVAITLLGLGSTASAQETRILTFDSPGADLTAGNFNGTYPSGINALGVIAGSYISADTVSHGFLRRRVGEFITFQAPGADTTAGSFNGTYPSSINDLGAIAGNFYDANGFSHGFLRSPDGNFTTFDVPCVGGFGSFPINVNVEGATAGYYTDSNYSFHAFLRTPHGKFTTWIGPDACTGNGAEGCFGSGATNINAFETVAGGFEDNSGNFVHHGLVRNAEGKLKTFDVPGAGTGSYQGTGCSSDCPVSLNDRGAITGIYIDANNVLHGYLLSAEGKIVTVDPVGSILTFPDGINDFGSITGYFLDANYVYDGFLTISDR